MLKIIKSKSEIKYHFKQCKSKSIPCVTLQFYSKNAVIRGDFDSTGIELPEDQRIKMQQDQKRLIDEYGLAVAAWRSYGQFPYIIVSVTAAYKFAMELTRIMYKYAGVEFPELKFSEGDVPIAEILRTTERQVVIQCPYCGRRHYHGIISLGGHMASHCWVKAQDDIGYIIKKL